MSRKPKDDVAASTTITLRLTPDDRQRIDRQIDARAADLPEQSMSALLRRLVRDAEEGVLLRLPAEDRALLDALVKERAAEILRLGVYEANVTPTSVMIGLIREAAKGRGIPLTSTLPASTLEPPRHDASAKAPPTRAADPDAATVHPALVAALEQGATQAEIAKRTGIDAGQLSRFKRTGSGLSPENLSKLAEALEAPARQRTE